jgi:hypothetical protein
MSEVERRKGRLIPVEMTFEKLLYICGVSEEDFLDDGYDKEEQSSWYDFLMYSDYENYLYANDKWYKIEEEEVSREGYFEDIAIQDDGSIDYHCQFYNGSNCLTQILEDFCEEHDA